MKTKILINLFQAVAMPTRCLAWNKSVSARRNSPCPDSLLEMGGFIDYSMQAGLQIKDSKSLPSRRVHYMDLGSILEVGGREWVANMCDPPPPPVPCQPHANKTIFAKWSGCLKPTPPPRMHKGAACMRVLIFSGKGDFGE